MFLSSIACLPRGCPSEETVRAGRPTAITLNTVLEGARKAGLPEMTSAIARIRKSRHDCRCVLPVRTTIHPLSLLLCAPSDTDRRRHPKSRSPCRNCCCRACRQPGSAAISVSEDGSTDGCKCRRVRLQRLRCSRPFGLELERLRLQNSSAPSPGTS
jgi:hypothetical protein